jgi:hypothetical protein
MSRLRKSRLEVLRDYISVSPLCLEDQGLRFSLQFVALNEMRPEVILN